MQFLKILFWCLLAFLAALFTAGNWTSVPIHLPGGLIADVNLPFLLLATFALGLVPMLLIHLAVRWRLRQRLLLAERGLNDMRAMVAAPAAEMPAEPPVETPPAPVAE